MARLVSVQVASGRTLHAREIPHHTAKAASSASATQPARDVRGDSHAAAAASATTASPASRRASSTSLVAPLANAAYAQAASSATARTAGARGGRGGGAGGAAAGAAAGCVTAMRRRDASIRPLLRRAIALAVAALALFVPPAHAAGFDTIFKDFKQDGRIEPCRYSAAELAKAKEDVPPDIEQYAPDFPDALQAAIEARAKGACTKKSS